MKVSRMLVAAMLLPASAANSSNPSLAAKAPSTPFTFGFGWTMRDGHQALVVATTNRSDHPQSVYSGLAEGFASNEMAIEMRVGGRRLKYRDHGYLPDPGKDRVIKPGDAFAGTYELRQIFRGLDSRPSLLGKSAVRVGFRFHPCASDQWSFTQSEWTKL